MSVIETILEPNANPVRLEAIFVVDDFIRKHRAAAIPALVGVCVAWAVENGGNDGADTMRRTLRRALDLVDAIEEIYQDENSRHSDKDA